CHGGLDVSCAQLPAPGAAATPGFVSPPPEPATFAGGENVGAEIRFSPVADVLRHYCHLEHRRDAWFGTASRGVCGDLGWQPLQPSALLTVSVVGFALEASARLVALAGLAAIPARPGVWRPAGREQS